MAAEEVLKLYDSYWFHLDIFTSKHTIPETISVDRQNQVQEPSFCPSVQVRSHSLYCLCSDTSFNPSSQSPKLESVVSGKEAKEDEIEIPMRRKKVEKKPRRRNKKGSRSLTELEFEELKGFMDLGFVFSEQDKDSRLASIVPGLQRYRKKGDEETGDDKDHEYKVSRPYLSEAWGVLDKTKVSNPLIDRTLQIPNGEIDMKDLLKVWAQSVASTVN
ncbi:WD repeat-containing protein 53-like [Heracleum sosnowskyi]|uniref:WD repeat-containing protein 53-like n=1 Tax=Heracleum sosnowskyi TaxID=360622 RepID=A0AAD8MXC1_9APIA|nr:WD repeat-containing protein 53-like [Heracleum sosnowskyi]